MVISVSGVVPMDVSSLANWEVYSLRSVSSFWLNAWFHFMMRWIKNIQLYLFCHHLLESDTISWVSIWLISGCVGCYGGFKVSNVLSLVKHDVFICIIKHQNINRCFPFDAVNTINNVYNLGPFLLLSCHWWWNKPYVNYWSCDLNWYDTIVSQQYFKWWFDCANCGLLFTVPCVC